MTWKNYVTLDYSKHLPPSSDLRIGSHSIIERYCTRAVRTLERHQICRSFSENIENVSPPLSNVENLQSLLVSPLRFGSTGTAIEFHLLCESTSIVFWCRTLRQCHFWQLSTFTVISLYSFGKDMHPHLSLIGITWCVKLLLEIDHSAYKVHDQSLLLLEDG